MNLNNNVGFFYSDIGLVRLKQARIVSLFGEGMRMSLLMERGRGELRPPGAAKPMVAIGATLSGFSAARWLLANRSLQRDTGYGAIANVETQEYFSRFSKGTGGRYWFSTYSVSYFLGLK